MRLRWTLPAAEDLEDIRDYLDLHSPQFSSSTVRKLYDGVRSLKSMPDRGRAGLKPGTREIVFHPLPYIVTYQVTDQTVEILRIYYGAQDRREHWGTVLIDGHLYDQASLCRSRISPALPQARSC